MLRITNNIKLLSIPKKKEVTEIPRKNEITGEFHLDDSAQQLLSIQQMKTIDAQTPSVQTHKITEDSNASKKLNLTRYAHDNPIKKECKWTTVDRKAIS